MKLSCYFFGLNSSNLEVHLNHKHDKSELLKIPRRKFELVENQFEVEEGIENKLFERIVL